MSDFPDFTKATLTLEPTGVGPARPAWKTPEGIEVATAYDASMQPAEQVSS